MNKSEKFFLLQKLDSLFAYSELLPDDFQAKYLEDLSSVKKFISEYKPIEVKPIENIPKQAVNEIPESPFKPIKKEPPPNTPVFNLQELGVSEEDEREPFKPLPKPPGGNIPPPPPPGKPGFVNYIKQPTANVSQSTDDDDEEDNKTIFPNPLFKQVEKKSSFDFVTNLLIPKITDEGKKMMGDLSLPINQYLTLKIIDNKTSLHKLFEKHHASHSSSFVEIASALYDLESAKYVTFVKTDNTSKDAGLIKIEEFIVDGKVISELNMQKAFEHQKTQGGIFVTKSLVALKFMTEDGMANCFRIQKWLARTLEKAPLEAIGKTAEVSHPIPPTGKPSGAPVPPKMSLTASIPGIPMPPPPPGAPQAPTPEPVFQEIMSGPLDFIIPVFNQKGKEILSDPAYKELANRISIIDGESSLLNNFVTNRESFKNNKVAFLKFVLKLEGQGIFSYKANPDSEEKEVWIKLGELLKALGLINMNQLQEALTLKEEKNIFVGEALVELNYIEANILEDCLKIQTWFNNVLSTMSYETGFVEVIKSVLMESFKCEVDISSFRKASFSEPLKDIVYIKYPIRGKLNGEVYYISDRFFMQNLAKTIMNSVGGQTSLDDFDESYVGVVSSVIISNSLAKLSQMGIFNRSEMASILMEKEVSMDKEIVVADRKTISLIPLNNQWGRFAIGLDVTSS